LKARVRIDGAALADTPMLVRSENKYYAWAHIIFDERCTIKLKILGSLKELEKLRKRVRAGDIVHITGRMLGLREHYITCWARYIKREADRDGVKRN
jgi:hypothetical protein